MSLEKSEFTGQGKLQSAFEVKSTARDIQFAYERNSVYEKNQSMNDPESLLRGLPFLNPQQVDSVFIRNIEEGGRPRQSSYLLWRPLGTKGALFSRTRTTALQFLDPETGPKTVKIEHQPSFSPIIVTSFCDETLSRQRPQALDEVPERRSMAMSFRSKFRLQQAPNSSGQAETLQHVVIFMVESEESQSCSCIPRVTWSMHRGAVIPLLQPWKNNPAKLHAEGLIFDSLASFIRTCPHLVDRLLPEDATSRKVSQGLWGRLLAMGRQSESSGPTDSHASVQRSIDSMIRM